MNYTEEKIRQINSYQGLIVNVTVDRVRLPDGHESYREVVHHPGGVCVLPVDENGIAYCVTQYRYGIGRHMLEAPAGKLEPGEEHAPAALRELSEETGFVPGRLIDLGMSFTSPGITTEGLHLFLALDLRRGEAHPDIGEFLDVVAIPLEELVERAMDNRLEDGKTITVALKAARYLAGERAEKH